ncbi:MAG TPA: CBS domain-containing protein [Polyangiaceae bacterium]|jgi:CBS domain-containing protein
MKVADLLEGEPVTASAPESAASVWERMHERRVDYVAVVDSAGRVVGLLSRQDLAGPSGGTRRRMGRTVGELMHLDVVTVTPKTELRRAAALMRKHATGCLPVVSRGKLVGVLTVSQLLVVLEHSKL